MIRYQPDIDKIYSYGKHPYEAKYQLVINKRESIGLNYLNGSRAFIEYSNNMVDIFKNMKEYNLNKKPKLLIVTGMLIKGRKLNISLAFITQSYFSEPKNIRIKYRHHIILKIPNKLEL